jgi:hypothetical protein
MTEETGSPYQSLITLYRRDGVVNAGEVDILWLKRA